MTESTLNLDARQRAMLDEMGVKVWWPSADAAEPVAIKTIAATASPERVAAPIDAKPASVAAPRAAPQAGGATVWLESPQRLYTADGPANGGWLIVVDMPPEADGRHGEAFAGDAGRLLENMLRALRLDRAGLPVHLARTHRGAAATERAGQPLDAGFAAAAEALAPRIVLALGPLAAQGLLASSEPLGKLRGRLASAAASPGTPLVASYHPVYLLRNPADKARAWADLCLAAEQLSLPN
ncbi:MAG: uracil-DNA glycosylase [Variovorax sp.]|nr:MAG: uracil-DNA glycosylase [Variovorax sp.]